MRKMDERRTQIVIVTPREIDPREFATVLADALAAADVSAVLLDIAASDDASWRSAAEVLGPVAQARGAAFLLRDHARLVVETGSDGTHASESPRALDDALKALRPHFIVGAGDCTTRHAAMTIGERNPDYVFLGRLDGEGDVPAARTLVEWWVDSFELPCVALAADDWSSVEALAAAQPDFVALRDLVWNDPDGPAAALSKAAAVLSASPETVG